MSSAVFYISLALLLFTFSSFFFFTLSMAFISSNASKQAGRRLSELLEQPQDPFLLEFYLLENGCSGWIADSQGSRFCWPSNAGKRQHKLGNHGGGRSSRAAALLTRVLFKLAHSKVIIKKAFYWCCNTTAGKSSGDLVFFSDDCKNRLNPVPAVEPQEFHESSPFDHQYECRSETPKKISSRRVLLFDCLREAEERILSRHGLPDSEMFDAAIDDLILSWEEQSGGLNNLSQMVASELSKEEWKHFKPEVREIGLCLEAAIFADLRRETVSAMCPSISCKKPLGRRVS